MRPIHLLLVFLVLLALGAQLYVQLHYDYRDAPEDVRNALVLGAGATALLVLLLGPRMLSRGRAGFRVP